jgi:glycogen operon protein
VLSLRRRHRLNLLASLLFSRGVPMLLAGDEFGNSQAGNNNAYAQDNEIGWVDWSGRETDPDFLDTVCELIGLRRRWVARAWENWPFVDDAGEGPVWRNPEGHAMTASDWSSGPGSLCALIGSDRGSDADPAGEPQLALLLNGHDGEIDFHLPEAFSWRVLASTSGASGPIEAPQFRAAAWSVALLTSSP